MSLLNGDRSEMASPEGLGEAPRSLSQEPRQSQSQSQSQAQSQNQNRNQNRKEPQPPAPGPTVTDSSNDESQDTTASQDTDRVFTPPESDSGSSAAFGNGNASSQESQLLQLSELAAAQEKIAETGVSRKRMADGVVKHTRTGSDMSPVRTARHSRNPSAVSAASTTASRMSELSAELKTKLSYAMLKVNNGWQSHSIDEVESLASQLASPTSSTSTLHGRHGACASPRSALAAARQGAFNGGTSPGNQDAQGRPHDPFWRDTDTKPSPASASPPKPQAPMLAPPAPIQPRQPGKPNARRNSNARYTPAFLSHPHQASPHTPAQPSPLQSTPGTRFSRTPNMDPILFSPHQNVREQEALETLVFMSSPGNSANLKHGYPSSQPRNGPPAAPRTALPGSRLGPGPEGHVRKSLPTGRPQTHGSQGKRVGFEKTPGNASDMDVDDAHDSPPTRDTPRRKTNGAAPRPPLSVPAGLGGPSRPRPPLQDDDIERMLDRVAAAESSDSEDEIPLPRGHRRGSTGVLEV